MMLKLSLIVTIVLLDMIVLVKLCGGVAIIFKRHIKVIQIIIPERFNFLELLVADLHFENEKYRLVLVIDLQTLTMMIVCFSLKQFHLCALLPDILYF